MRHDWVVGLFLCLGLSVYGQTNNWAPVGATWWYDQDQAIWPSNVTYIKVSSVKDTMVLGQQCRKLIKKEIGPNRHLHLGVLFTFEDSGKVYYLTPTTSKFSLWMDFSADVGDTVTVFPEFVDHQDSLILRIDSIKPISVGGQVRKRFYHYPVGSLSLTFGFSWIEGIGSDEYFTPQLSYADPPEGGAIRCYEDTSVGLVHVGVNDCDYIYTSVEKIDQTQTFPVTLANSELFYDFRKPTISGYWTFWVDWYWINPHFQVRV